MPVYRKIRGRLIPGVQIGCVLASAWFVWTRHVLPRLGVEPLPAIIGNALLYVVLAWIGAAFIAFWVYFVVLTADLPHAAGFSLRTSAPAMWFAPAIVLLPAPVPGAFGAGLFLVAAATLQLIGNLVVADGPVEAGIAPADHAPAALFSWNSAPVFMASLTAQSGVVALLWGYRWRAATLLALSTAMLTALSIAGGAYRPEKPPTLPHSSLSVALTFLLAVALTFGGIASARGGWGRGVEGSGKESADASSQTDSRTLPAAEPDPAVGGDFPGVILLPEQKPDPTIFVPVISPPGTPGALRLRVAPKPFNIPFSGEYWMYRWPASRPPRRSIIRRGNAAELSFHTTDGWPMEMEAHQKLDTPVAIDCCREIQLAIRNADPYPGMISLELILIDTSIPGFNWRSLGAVRLQPVPASEQTLTFQVPTNTMIRKFDELKVVFHRDMPRADKSARMAIDRFVLVP